MTTFLIFDAAPISGIVRYNVKDIKTGDIKEIIYPVIDIELYFLYINEIRT